MTTNAFLFSWDCNGIEAIVPITQYESWEEDNLVNVLKGLDKKPNPLNQIVSSMKMRARFNTHRHYEIYAVDCDDGLDQLYWQQRWEEDPQFCADLVREHGIKIYSDRREESEIRIR